jgi:RNA polymerase sigma factor (sigma-70 family)
MPLANARQLAHHLHCWLISQSSGQSSDSHLLERFVRQGDEAAFTELVQRYGALVLRVCRRQLHDDHEAEDAFQATFLVLARKAASIRQRESLGAWLYGVAYRIARRLRDSRRGSQAGTLDSCREPAAHDETSWRETVALLDEELHRLPEKYRVPLVLCYLNGQAQTQVSAQLGLPLRTLELRLAQGREMLRRRLIRRGVEWSAVVVALELSVGAAPAALVHATVSAALTFSTDQAAAAVDASARALALAQGALQVMAISKIKLAAAIILFVGVFGMAIGLPSDLSPAAAEATECEAWLAAPPAPSADKTARDMLVLDIDEQGRLTGPGQKEPLTKPADIEAYLKRQYQTADTAAKVKGEAESKVKTTVRIEVHKKTGYPAAFNVLKLAKTAGFNELQMRGISKPVDVTLKDPELTVIVKMLRGSDGAISAIIVDTADGQVALPNHEALGRYLKIKRDELANKQSVHLQPDQGLHWEAVVGVAEEATQAGFQRVHFREDPEPPAPPAADTVHKARPHGTDEAGRQAALVAGLKWLARHQAEDGHWSLQAFHLDGKCNCTGPGGKHDVAATAFGLLPFLGAGEDLTWEAVKEKNMARQVEHGLNWLLARQAADGTFGLNGYEHALATLALCRAYGISKDANLKGPAQRAINCCVAWQHQAGGFRYTPKIPGDLSVTGWFVQALKAGQAAELNVPNATWNGINNFLDQCSTPDGSGYGYQQPQPSLTMTAVGLLCRQHMGWGQRNAGLQKGLEYLNKVPPSPNFKNLYYYFYATKVMNLDMADSLTWNQKMRRILIEEQDWGGDADRRDQKGSWSPAGDAWGGQFGRVAMTSFALLTLEAMDPLPPLGNLTPKKLDEKELPGIWTELATDNGFKATTTMRTLVAAPAQAVPYLQEKLRPAPVADEKITSRWIADLRSNNFQARQKADEELEKLGESARPALQKALEGKPTLDLRQRLERLLAKAEDSFEQLRLLRAIRVLEYIGTPEARKVLQTVATGNSAARLTQEAKAALGRIEKRAALP